MSKQMKNFLTIVGIIVLGAFLGFLYDCIVGLSEFAGRISPALVPWVFWTLLTVVAGFLVWWASLILVRPRPILVHADPSPEDMARFRQELVKRLSGNRILKTSGVWVRSEADLETGLAVLKEKANEEIRGTAKRVFIGSAISQNGRLDSLVVLFLISRLAWRISKIYCQRPHYRELVNLYVNIAVTSFLAGSIEEFGVEEYIHELMGPVVAGSALGAMPGAGAVAGVVTASILSGSTNALLAMRCGIVARNYMGLDLNAKGAMRRSATLEAAGMFMSISGETVTQVTRLLVKGSSGAVRDGARKAFKSMGRTVTNATGSMGSGAKSAGQKVKDSATAAGRGVTDSTRTVVDGVDRIVDRAADHFKRSARKMIPVVEKAEARMGEAAGKAKGALLTTGKSVEQRARKLRDALFRKASGKPSDKR